MAVVEILTSWPEQIQAHVTVSRRCVFHGGEFTGDRWCGAPKRSWTHVVVTPGGTFMDGVQVFNYAMMDVEVITRFYDLVSAADDELVVTDPWPGQLPEREEGDLPQVPFSSQPLTGEVSVARCRSP